MCFGDDAIATVTNDGVVTGVSQGMVNITYTLPTGCERVREVTVNPTPTSITGANQACASGGTTMLNSSPSGGSWTTGSSVIATVNASNGIIYVLDQVLVPGQ